MEWNFFRFYKKNVLWGIYHLKVGTQLNLHTLNLLHLFFILQWSNIQIEGIRFYIDVNNKTDDWHVSDNSMAYHPFWGVFIKMRFDCHQKKKKRKNLLSILFHKTSFEQVILTIELWDHTNKTDFYLLIHNSTIKKYRLISYIQIF